MSSKTLLVSLKSKSNVSKSNEHSEPLWFYHSVRQLLSESATRLFTQYLLSVVSFHLFEIDYSRVDWCACEPIFTAVKVSKSLLLII